MSRNIYLTFDMDWAIDEVLEYFYELLEKYHVVGTLNVTHESPLLQKFERSGIIELGIHPNYNGLLYPEQGGGDCEAILARMKELVPNAVCCRSHSLTTSSVIAKHYKKYGIRYDLNMLIPAYKGMRIRPFAAPVDEDILVLPFIYEDDIYLQKKDRMQPEEFLLDEIEAPRIFNFHPIHLFLNSDRVETYEKARPFFKDYQSLKRHVNKANYGIKDFFVELIDAAHQSEWKFKTIAEGEWK